MTTTPSHKASDRRAWSTAYERHGHMHPRDERRARLDIANLLLACRDTHGAADLAALTDAGYHGAIVEDLGTEIAVEIAVERSFAAPPRYVPSPHFSGGSPRKALAMAEARP